MVFGSSTLEAARPEAPVIPSTSVPDFGYSQVRFNTRPCVEELQVRIILGARVCMHVYALHGSCVERG